MAFKLTWLSTVLQNAGLKVAEVDGWQNRGRREIGSVRGVICHHTGGPKSGNMPSLNLLIRGRNDLPGPLAQLGLGRDGTFFVIAAGRCNHAGKGEWQSLTDGNGQFIGIEAENTGSEPWPEVQLDAYHRGVAAILKHIGEPAIMCCGHKEYAPKRKPDPHIIDMQDFRKQVAAIIAGTTPARLPIPGKDSKDRPTLRRSSPTNPKFLVEDVQKKLGFSGTQVDGRFGPSTEAKLRQFQRDHGLVPDGIVGPKTWEKLDTI